MKLKKDLSNKYRKKNQPRITIHCILMGLLFSMTFQVSAQNFGEQDHPMNKSTDSREILKYWGTTPDGEINLYESAYKILSMDQYLLMEKPSYQQL